MNDDILSCDNEKEENENLLEGRNAVAEAIKAGRQIDKLFVLSGDRDGNLQRIVIMARERNIPIQEVDRRRLDQLSQTSAHQGIIANCAVKEYSTIEDILDAAHKKNEPPFIIICDEISDPHNLGAIIRTADAVGAHGVIIPKRRSVGLTSSVAKASAGAVEYVMVAKVTNISTAIDQLKDAGLWIYAADADCNDVYFNTDLKGSIAIVIGSEGKGISRLVREKCDFLVKIPMKGSINSLNASVAGAVIMYEVLRQRGQK